MQASSAASPTTGVQDGANAKGIGVRRLVRSTVGFA